jgi:hypothetical protein
MRAETASANQGCFKELWLVLLGLQQFAAASLLLRRDRQYRLFSREFLIARDSVYSAHQDDGLDLWLVGILERFCRSNGHVRFLSGRRFE